MSSHILPLVSIAGYLAYPRQLRINQKLLYTFSVIHNTLLVAFSAWSFVSLSRLLYNNGIVFQSNYYFLFAENKTICPTEISYIKLLKI